jgi:hypothetical protein
VSVYGCICVAKDFVRIFFFFPFNEPTRCWQRSWSSCGSGWGFPKFNGLVVLWVGFGRGGILFDVTDAVPFGAWIYSFRESDGGGGRERVWYRSGVIWCCSKAWKGW